MKMKKFVLISLFLLLIRLAFASQLQNIVIDTDCGIDDFRAITMLMSVKEITIDAIITTDGILDAEQSYQRIKQLLYYLNRTDIPVFVGYHSKNYKPFTQSKANLVKWGNDTSKFDLNFLFENNFVSVLKNNPVYIALGPLSTLSMLLKLYNTDITKIYWYNEKAFPFKGFNYQYDSIAAINVISTNKDLFILTEDNKISYDFDLIKNVSAINNISGKAFAKAHYFVLNNAATYFDHLYLWDDMVSLFYIFPELFYQKPVLTKPNIKIVTAICYDALKYAILDIYKQQYSLNHTVVFNKSPFEKDFLSYDIQVVADSIIKKYGYNEWRVCLLTHEIHGHLGIYSLIGAKMGIKARELLNAPLDKIKIVSYAGNITPLSCFNDGLQISTGSTLGQGLITLSDEPQKKPEADFYFQNKAIKMRLKEEYLKIIESDMHKGIVQYGLLTDGYWKMVRELAIRYWYEFDRDKIFDVETLVK
jgi:pyrimidine-specific ribonucleoside hydrolase